MKKMNPKGQNRCKRPYQRLGDVGPLTEEQKKLVEANIGLVGLHLRTRVRLPREPNRSREYEDLFQEGCVALMRAAQRFDPKRNGSFAAFALPRIRCAVHLALHEHFSIVHVPNRARVEMEKNDPDANLFRPGEIAVISEQMQLIDQRPDQTGDNIRHALRHRFELAVQSALAALEKRTWRHRNPVPIMRRIAAERMLINAQNARTPLRQIAQAFDVSSGRASAYEKKLTDAVMEELQKDQRVQMLIDYAAEDPEGFNGRIDERRRRALADVELLAFDREFSGMNTAQRAEAIYRLIEQSSGAVDEVARNLYRLTLRESGDGLAA